MLMKKPLVSVIMNCFNGERFLKEAIDSVYAQSYYNWEIIFWDNGSSDNTALIAKSYDDKLRYFSSKNTTSLGLARNEAIEKAKGKYITFLDCDDLYLPDRIAIQTSAMINSQTVLSFGSWIEINEFGDIIKKHKIQTQSGNLFEQLMKRYTVNFQTLMLDNDFFKKSKIHFDDNLTFAPDFNIVMQIALNNNVSSLDSYFAKYRVHSKSMSHTHKQDKYNDYAYNIEILKDKGAGLKSSSFNYFATSMLFRMKYRDNLNSRNYFSAFIYLIKYLSYAVKNSLIR